VEHYICTACGTQFLERDEPPPECPICVDPRQYIPPGGQQWTTMAALAADHSNEIRPEGELTGIATAPHFAIGQRALLVPHGDSNLLWDCITLLDDASAEEIKRRGGLAGIAISHPHYYSGMVDWAHRFGCPIHLHAADAEWIMRPDPVVELWDKETLDLGHGLTLIRAGGHFPGGTVLHWAHGPGALLTGDIIQVIPDRSHVAFMWSYPNQIPLPGSEVEALGATVALFDYEALYGAWWGTVIEQDAKTIVERSVERYGAALRGELLR
jgi:hypothetical protein